MNTISIYYSKRWEFRFLPQPVFCRFIFVNHPTLVFLHHQLTHMKKLKRMDCQKKTGEERSRSTAMPRLSCLHPRSQPSLHRTSSSSALQSCRFLLSRGGRAAHQDEPDWMPSRQHDRSSPPGWPLLHRLPPWGPSKLEHLSSASSSSM
jgi:hypothetical protein